MSKISLIIAAITSFSLLFVATASFLLKAKMIFILVPVVVIFTVVLVGTGVFLLSSRLLSDSEKEILRKFLFFISPEYGWGINSSDAKKSTGLWLIYAITTLLIGIVVGLFSLLR